MGNQQAQITLYFVYKNAGEKGVRDVRSEEQEQYDEDDDEEDEVAEPYSILFEKRATLFVKAGNDTTWTHVALGNLIIYYDPNVYREKIVLKADETDEIVSATIIGADTKMQVDGKECIWTAIGYTLDSLAKHTYKAVLSSVQAAQLMYHHFQRGVEFAKQEDVNEQIYATEDI